MTAAAHASPGLLLIEGLPGSGKSTTAHLLCRHLERQGRPTRWYWELESPHPVFEFQEALDGDQLRAGFVETALANWTRFAAGLATRRELVILECSWFQSAVHPMLLLDWPETRIARYIASVERIVADIRPLLVVLRVSDVGARLRELEGERGPWCRELLEPRICASPFARARNLHGAAAVIGYLEAFRDLTDALCDRLHIETLVLDASDATVSFVDRIGRALGLPPCVRVETPLADLERFAGLYTRADSEDGCRILTDGTDLFVDGAPPLRLIHHDAWTFEATGTCVQFDFLAGDDGGVRGLACHGALPDLAADYVRSA